MVILTVLSLIFNFFASSRGSETTDGILVFIRHPERSDGIPIFNALKTGIPSLTAFARNDEKKTG